MTTTAEYDVKGMTCDHCASSVRDEVRSIEGVATVDVDLSTGRIVVSGRNVAVDAVRRAVETAGYELA